MTIDCYSYFIRPTRMNSEDELRPHMTIRIAENSFRLLIVDHTIIHHTSIKQYAHADKHFQEDSYTKLAYIIKSNVPNLRTICSAAETIAASKKKNKK